jgi:hypothetical protein
MVVRGKGEQHCQWFMLRLNVGLHRHLAGVLGCDSANSATNHIMQNACRWRAHSLFVLFLILMSQNEGLDMFLHSLVNASGMRWWNEGAIVI